MSKTYKRYTEEEDSRIIEVISNNPHNLTDCFKLLSAELGRSCKSIHNRWYNTLRKREACFITYGKSTVSTNSKVIKKSSKVQSKKVKLNLWQRILKILFK